VGKLLGYTENSMLGNAEIKEYETRTKINESEIKRNKTKN